MMRGYLVGTSLALLAGLAPAAGQPPAPMSGPVGEALALLDQGNLDAAIALLEPLRSDPKTPATARAMLGALYLEKGRFDDALATLQPLAAAEKADPAVLYNAGRAALALGRTEAGEAFLERSVARSPLSPAARELGLLRGRQGQMAEAYRLLRPWAMAHPDDAEASLAAAQAAVDLGRPAEARAILVAQDAESPPVRVLRAAVARLEGQPTAVLEELTGVLQQQLPESLLRQGLWLAADALLALGRPQEAVDALAGLAITDARLSLLYAQALHQGGKLDEALAALEPWSRRTLEIGEGKPSPPGPAAAPILIEYGRMLVAAERAEEAARALRQGLAWSPESLPGWQSLGEALTRLGHRQEAEAALQKFRQLSQARGDRPTLEQRLRVQTTDATAVALSDAAEAISRGELDKALRIVRLEAGLAPEDPRPHLLEARICLSLSRLDEALQAAEAAVRTGPQMADAYYQRGVVHLARKATDAGEADLRQALSLAPAHSAALNDLGALLMTRGDLAAAQPLWEKAVALRPDDKLAAENLRQLKARLTGRTPPS
jgi:tetratricopeptide (TPR) repeat protein